MQYLQSDQPKTKDPPPTQPIGDVVAIKPHHPDQEITIMLDMFSQLWSMLTTFINACHEYMSSFEDSGKYLKSVTGTALIKQELDNADQVDDLKAQIAVRRKAQAKAAELQLN